MKIVRPLAITDAVLASSSVPETDYPVYSAATTYALDAKVIVTSAGTHRIYQSLQAGNLNHAPGLAASALWWSDQGPTNKWAMFDDKRGTQTSAAGSIAVTLNLSGRNNTLGVMNVTGADTIHATMSVGGVTVYDKTASMTARKGATDWYSWFFEPRQYLTDLVLTDLPPYLNAVLTVTITGTGSVACGSLIVGNSLDLGLTQFGIGLGITSYSKKDVDEWGNYVIQKRAFSKRRSFPVEVLNNRIDPVTALLESLDAVPILYIGTERYAATAVFGFYKDFNLEIPGPVVSQCTLEIEGLT